MPYEDSLPLLVGCLAVAAVCAWLWRTVGQAVWMWLAVVAACSGFGLATIDYRTVTEREYLEILLSELAYAVQQKDLPTLLEAIAPEVRPVREQAERAVKRLKPTSVVITKLEITVDETAEPPAATAEMFVRVSGAMVGHEETMGIVAATVSLEKRGRWLVTDCVVKPAEPLGSR